MTVADFKRLPRQNHGSAQRFFWMIFRDEMMDYKGGIKTSVSPFWQGEIFDLKVVRYLDESKSLNT